MQARGDGTIAAYSTNVWEGQIRVSGVYPDLIDMDTSSASFGSGKVITLNLSPLGISATKFQVKGIVVEANQTTIIISNDDVMVEEQCPTILQRQGAADRGVLRAGRPR